MVTTTPDNLHGLDFRLVSWAAEASGCLVTPAASKADVAEQLGQAGSIPVRLRQSSPERARLPAGIVQAPASAPSRNRVTASA